MIQLPHKNHFGIFLMLFYNKVFQKDMNNHLPLFVHLFNCFPCKIEYIISFFDHKKGVK